MADTAVQRARQKILKSPGMEVSVGATPETKQALRCVSSFSVTGRGRGLWGQLQQRLSAMI